MREHTRLTVSNYAGFAGVMLAVGLVTTGFGMVDLLMVAPKGVNHVAAVGQGSVLLMGVSAFFLGVIDAFAGRLAIAEGEGTTARRLPSLAAALLVTLALCQLAALLLTAVTEPVLSLLRQDRDLVPLLGDYMRVRLYGVGVVMLYAAFNEALKTCGAKNRSLATLVLGFGVNALFNWVFLETGWARFFASPESAVATATVIANTVMAATAAWMFAAHMRTRGERFYGPKRAAVLRELRSTSVAGAGVGARHVNDYVGSIVPMTFIGTMGVKTLAASVIAANIYTVFCRVPQACVQATFVYYGYAVGQKGADRVRTVRTLLSYTAVPTAVAALLVVISSPWLVAAFAGPGLDRSLAVVLLLAYLLYLPAYIFDQSLSTLLVVHQRGAVLFVASTLATYLLTIPLSWYAVFLLDSAFLAVASNGVATAVQAAVFWRMLRREVHVGTEVRVA
ncbi:MATE family efflux transporter [Streptomyces sp. NPDC002144]